MKALPDALRQPPDAPEGAALVEWLRAVDRTGHGWDELFEALLQHGDGVAREFADVATADEARTACMELTYERWMGEWLDGASRGAEGRPLAVFVGDRLRDHLRAMRRKRQRRAAMDRARVAPPHADGRAVEADGRVDAFARNVLWMLLRHHPQKEIARVLGASEATVSRAVALLRTLFETLARE